MRRAAWLSLLLWLAFLTLYGCKRESESDVKTPTQFQTDFVKNCVSSIQNPSFSWMPARYADGVCRCAAPRVEAQLHQAGFDKGDDHSATELANASRTITAATVECAKPVFVEVMTDTGKRQCLDTANPDPRLKSLTGDARDRACSCAATAYGNSANLGLALQFEKRAQFEKQGSEMFGQALTQCGIK